MVLAVVMEEAEEEEALEAVEDIVKRKVALS